MRVIRFRVTTKKFERKSGKLLSEKVQECASAAGAAACLWQVPVGQSMNNIQLFIRSKTILEIGNGRGWTEYEPNIDQPIAKLKADILHAAELHLVFYDDGEGRKGVAP